MRPIVQISLDLTNIDEALETAAMALRAGVDWLEAGTPLLLAEGLHGVRKLREAFPEIPADLFVETVQLNPVKVSNIAIDSVSILSKNTSLTQLKVNFSKPSSSIISILLLTILRPSSVVSGSRVYKAGSIVICMRNLSISQRYDSNTIIIKSLTICCESDAFC